MLAKFRQHKKRFCSILGCVWWTHTKKYRPEASLRFLLFMPVHISENENTQLISFSLTSLIFLMEIVAFVPYEWKPSLVTVTQTCCILQLPQSNAVLVSHYTQSLGGKLRRQVTGLQLKQQLQWQQHIISSWATSCSFLTLFKLCSLVIESVQEVMVSVFSVFLF